MCSFCSSFECDQPTGNLQERKERHSRILCHTHQELIIIHYLLIPHPHIIYCMHVHSLRPHPQQALCVGVLHHEDDVICRWGHTNIHKDIRVDLYMISKFHSGGISRFRSWFQDFICDFWFHLWFLISTVISGLIVISDFNVISGNGVRDFTHVGPLAPGTLPAITGHEV